MHNDELMIEPYIYPPAALLTRRLPTLTVEHIGSTSIPGCAGKGVIDLMILYPPGQREDVKHILADLGFQPQPNANPHPESRPCRVGTTRYDGDVFRIHAHVIPPGSPEIAQQRAFRDRLSADPRLVATYVATKRDAIAARRTDAARYNADKEPFIQSVLRDTRDSPPHNAPDY